MVHKSESAILVGTQMLAKGHDFPRVELGIILNCDSGITSPDINSLEKISQLLIQVSGRVGRKENNGSKTSMVLIISSFLFQEGANWTLNETRKSLVLSNYQVKMEQIS